MATRNLTDIVRSALDGNVFYPFYTLVLSFDAGDVNLWTGFGDITIGSTTYAGGGEMLKISSVQETADLSVRGIEVTLSGLDNSILPKALGSQYQGRKCNLSFGAFDTGQLQKESGDFILQEDGSKINLELISGGLNTVFVGYMDQMNITESGDSSTISLKVENKLIDLESPRVPRYNSGYQQSVFSGDLGYLLR